MHKKYNNFHILHEYLSRIYSTLSGPSQLSSLGSEIRSSICNSFREKISQRLTLTPGVGGEETMFRRSPSNWCLDGENFFILFVNSSVVMGPFFSECIYYMAYKTELIPTISWIMTMEPEHFSGILSKCFFYNCIFFFTKEFNFRVCVQQRFSCHI